MIAYCYIFIFFVNGVNFLSTTGSISYNND